MKLSVKVKPSAKENRLDDLGGGHLAVFVKAAATDGRANRAAVSLVAEHLGISAFRIKIISGHAARNKIFLVD